MTATGDNPLVPVTLLTGFLGSGKTTVLNRLLRRPDMSATAVIVNEFGEVGLDHVLLERSSAGTVLLANGCVCCTVRGDLAATLQDLVLQRIRGEIPEFNRVIIETTGLADPAPILHMLMVDAMIAARYRLGGVVATADAVNGYATLDRYLEAVKQVAVADRILVTKTDLPDSRQARVLRERLAALNPGARMMDVVAGDVEPGTVLDCGLYQPRTKSLDVQGWLRAEAYRQDAGDACEHGPDSGHGHDHGRDTAAAPHHDHGIRSYCLTRDQPLSWSAFSAWMEALTLRRGEDLLRVKGIVDIAERPGQPFVIHGVQQVFHPPVALEAWPSEDHRTRVVFITRNLERKVIEETLRIFGELRA